MLLISQVKVRIDSDNTDLTSVISKKLRISMDNILGYTVERRSIDARHKDDIFFVYNLYVKVQGEKKILSKNIPNVSKQIFKYDEIDYSKLKYNTDKKIAIIGFGPAGLFSALKFSQCGVNVTVYERGEAVEDRMKTIEKFESEGILNTESNIQFGEGGAGTYSDGKLTARRKDQRDKWLFQQFVNAGAPEEILYVQNPHIGTDKLVNVVRHIRKEIESSGSCVHFNSKVTDIKPFEQGINVTVNNTVHYFNHVILAIGHSSRDTIEMLYKNNCEIVQKPFAVGFRIEHLQSMVNKAQFGKNFKHPKLGAAEYKLTHKTENRGVYTFCMCPGGMVVPAASEEGMLVVNGMSEFKRDKINANSALLVTVDGKDFNSDHPLAGIEYQRSLEQKAYKLGGSDYKAPIQTVNDFINNKVTTELGKVLPSYSIGIRYSNLRSIFSEEINEAFIEALSKFGNKLKGFDSKDAILTGVESRSSSAVRILRNHDTMQSTSFNKLYPTGEGAGYAGGIISAAIDGIKVAEQILYQIKK